MKKSFIAITILSLFPGCAGHTEDCVPEQDGNCQAPAAVAGGEEDTASVQQGLTYKYKTFYISNPKTLANKYTGKSKALRVTARIASGSSLVDINFNKSIWGINYIPCSGTYCSATRYLFGCQNYGTIPVTVTYTGAATPTLSYWFTDCY